MRSPVVRPFGSALAAAVLVATATPAAAQTAYVASYHDNAVYKYTYAGGTTWNKDTSFSLTVTNPSSLTVGPDRNLYIGTTGFSTPSSSAVYKYDVAADTVSTYLSAGTLNTIAGTQSGGAQAAYAPSSLRFSSDGSTLFLVRSGGSADFSGTAGVDRLNVANVTAGGGYTGTVTTVAAGLFVPGGMAYSDATDTLVVSNTFNIFTGMAVERVTGAGTVADTSNQTTFLGPVAPPATAAASLNSPAGLALDGNDLYVVDSDRAGALGAAGRVRRYNATTGALDASFADTNSTLTQKFSEGVTVFDGTVFVAAQGNESSHTPGLGNGAVYAFDAGGNLLYSFAPGTYATAVAFQPVPEPAHVLAACGLVVAAGRLVGRRRKAAAPVG